MAQHEDDMAANPAGEVLQSLRRSLLARDGAGLTDAELLALYLAQRDEAALAALINRHAGMVWGVCRRILGNAHDAEDAFQATFLVFVRKVGSIRNRDLLANWLYGVARQTAQKARSTKARQRQREQLMMNLPEPAAEERLRDDLQPLLDEELGRLPEKYRAAIVVCDLEGLPRPEAARCLGCPEGTVASRLTRAREMLAKRLGRHGLPVTAAVLAAALTQQPAGAAVPAAIIQTTIKSASSFAAGPAAGAVSLPVAALTEGVLKMMLMKKLTHVATLVVLTCLVGVAASAWLMGQSTPADDSALAVYVPIEPNRNKPDMKKAIEDELQKLNGGWRLVQLEKGGKLVDKETWGRNTRRYFAGTKVTYHSGMRVASGEIKLDPLASPKAMDEKWIAAGQNHGIYELKGDTLRIFMVPATEARPTEFKTKEGSEQAIATFERMKPIDPARAATVPVVLRVKDAKAFKSRAILYSEITVVEVLKNTSGQALGEKITVVTSTLAGSELPRGEFTIYLKDFKARENAWEPIELNVGQKAVSDVGAEPKSE